MISLNVYECQLYNFILGAPTYFQLEDTLGKIIMIGDQPRAGFLQIGWNCPQIKYILGGKGDTHSWFPHELYFQNV